MTSNERSSSSAAIALVLRLVVVLSLAVAALAGFTASPAAAAQHERKIAAPRSARLSSSAAFNPSPQHAYRAAQSKSTEVLVLLIALLPAQGHRELLCAAEYASGLSDAGGDPVNDGDPSGDIAAPEQAGDMCLPNPSTGAYGSDVCIGQVGMAACVDAVSAAFPVNEPGGGNLAADLCSGAFDGVAPGTSWNNLVENYNPAFGVLYWTQQAWDVAQDPCSSNWSVLEDSLNAFNSADATVLAGLGGADAGDFAADGGSGFPELPPRDDFGGIRSTSGPSESPIWQDLQQFRGSIRTNGLAGASRRLFEWDYTHGDIEVYNGRGVHLGSMDPVTGEMSKGPVPGRTITP
jgi:hypothetical protein